MGKNDDDQTYTRDEVEAIIDARLKSEKMGDEEKQIRTIVRDEVKGVLGEFFTIEDDDDDDEAPPPPKGNAPGSKGDEPSLFQRLAGALAGDE